MTSHVPDPYAGPPRQPDTSALAVTALISGILANIFCLPVIGGLIAIVTGLVGRHRIRRSNGTLDGGTMAISGAALGAVHLLICAGLTAAFALRVARPRPTPPAPPPVVLAPTAPPTTTVPAPTSAPPPSKTGDATVDDGVIVTQIGILTVVDIGRDAGTLASELNRQRVAAKRDGKQLLLWLGGPECKPCSGVAAALPDPALQSALTNHRLVRVNIRAYKLELRRLGVPEGLPGFALLDAGNHVIDFVHGGEWDADIPTNIAPVLAPFVRGTYTKRRHQWKRPAGPDATPI